MSADEIGVWLPRRDAASPDAMPPILDFVDVSLVLACLICCVAAAFASGGPIGDGFPNNDRRVCLWPAGDAGSVENGATFLSGTGRGATDGSFGDGKIGIWASFDDPG